MVGYCTVRYCGVTASQVEKEKALRNKGKGTVETAGWRTQGVQARLTHSLIKGIDQYVIEVMQCVVCVETLELCNSVEVG